jgi:uncharacterized membrane protein
MDMAVRNPIEWGLDQLKLTETAIESTGHAAGHAIDPKLRVTVPAVRRIEIADLRDVLAKGLDDFGAYRTDAIFLCVIYPVIGIVLARLASGYGLVPLLFPLASGFALIGPFAAVGLNEMSRRREMGGHIAWPDAFGVFSSPSFGAIVMMGVVLIAIFMAWIFAAHVIYDGTLGPEPPTSIGAFIHDVFATSAGWTMIIVGVGVGFLFALLVLAISVVSFPLLLDRDVGVDTAVWTSVRVVAENPRPMAAWGLIVAGALVIGSIPFFLGLVIVLPVLGHATWHLYRKVVPR